MLKKEENVNKERGRFGSNHRCLHHVYTVSENTQWRENVGLTTYPFFLDVQKAHDAGNMDKWAVEKYVGHWGKRDNVENDYEDDRMCQK